LRPSFGNPSFCFGRKERGFLLRLFIPVVSPALNVGVVAPTEFLLLELLASLLTEDLPSALLSTISTKYFDNFSYSPGVKSGVVL